MRAITTLLFILSSHFDKITYSQSSTNSSKPNMLRNMPKTMRAVGLYKYLAISDRDSLIDLEVDVPKPRPNDVLVEVKAISVNPIDTKQRAPKPRVETVPRILGWDGSGVVVGKGESVMWFNVGDEVYFAGDIGRNGCNAQYVAVDEVLVGLKPKTFSYEQAAAMPLTTLTAYESLVDRLQLSEKDIGKSILIINSAGGVGSIATQIARNMGLTVIGTASRNETRGWTMKLGSEYVLNHTQDLLPQLEKYGFGDGVDYVMVNYDPYPYWSTITTVIKPQGKICLIVDSSAPLDMAPLKDKSLTVVSEMMATRIKYNTDDKYRLHEFLKKASQEFDSGKLKCTLWKTFTPINAYNVKKAHKLLEEKHVEGKLVISGF